MDLKNYEFQSDFFRRAAAKFAAEEAAKASAEAAAKAKAADVLAVLAARGVEVPDHTKAQISECTDVDTLDTWLRRAATAESTDDVLDYAEPSSPRT